jgi:hypothetical protein
MTALFGRERADDVRRIESVAVAALFSPKRGDCEHTNPASPGRFKLWWSSISEVLENPNFALTSE